MKDLMWRLAGAVLLVGIAFHAAWASPDYYTAEFFTRGADAAFYVDSGDTIYDPFYIPVRRYTLVPRLTILGTREDNLFMNAQGTRATTIRAIPGVALIYGRPEARHVFVDYGAIVPLYSTNDAVDDQVSHLVTVGGAYATAKSHLNGRAGYRRLEQVDTLVGARIVKEDYIANLALEHRLSGKTLIGPLGSFERHDFQADRYVDYDRYYGAMRVFYETTPRSQAFVQGGLGHDDLDADSDGWGDADFYDVSLGMRGKPTPKSQVSGRAGYQWREVNRVQGADEAVEHWIASLYGEVNPFGFTTFSSELYSDLRPAVNAAGSTSIDQRWTGSVARRLFIERLRGQASVFFGRVDYRSPRDEPDFRDPDGLVYDGRRDEYWGYTLGLDWRWKHNLSCGLSYSYVDNRAARGAVEEVRNASAYDAGRWQLRMSWNF